MFETARTHLEDAARSGDAAAVARALEHDKRRRASALRCAAYAGELDVVELLLQAGAAVDAGDAGTVMDRGGGPGFYGGTALHLAAARGHVDTVRCLLAAGATVDALDDLGETPLHSACKGQAGTAGEVVAVLRLAGAPSEQVTWRLKETPIQVAARHGCEAAVLELRRAAAQN